MTLAQLGFLQHIISGDLLSKNQKNLSLSRLANHSHSGNQSCHIHPSFPCAAQSGINRWRVFDQFSGLFDLFQCLVASNRATASMLSDTIGIKAHDLQGFMAFLVAARPFLILYPKLTSLSVTVSSKYLFFVYPIKYIDKLLIVGGCNKADIFTGKRMGPLTGARDPFNCICPPQNLIDDAQASDLRITVWKDPFKDLISAMK